jgi:hypothetical protein
MLFCCGNFVHAQTRLICVGRSLIKLPLRVLPICKTLLSARNVNDYVETYEKSAWNLRCTHFFLAQRLRTKHKSARTVGCGAMALERTGQFFGWKTVRITDPKVANGALQGRTEDFSRLESPLLKIDAGRLIDLDFRIKSTMGGPGLLIFSREGEERSDDRLINFAIVGDNQFHT